jgi:hypothetical protein
MNDFEMSDGVWKVSVSVFEFDLFCVHKAYINMFKTTFVSEN